MSASQDRQPRLFDAEGYLQNVGTECQEHAEASSTQGMAPAENANMQCRHSLMERVVDKDNMREAYAKVRSNRGSAGVDRMGVSQMHDYFKEHADELFQQVKEGRYTPSPVLRVEIPKQEKGKVRKLGIPTVVDRVVQQATALQLAPLFEPRFHDSSYGFRPNRSAHDALRACKRNVDEGYTWVVDMDLEKFFDTVCQSKLIQILSETVRDGRVVSLIHEYLNAGVMVNGVMEETRVGVPQGGPLPPQLANITLNELDWELGRRGHRFVRYADDAMIFCKSKKGSPKNPSIHHPLYRGMLASQGEYGQDLRGPLQPCEISWICLLSLQGGVPPQEREEDERQGQGTYGQEQANPERFEADDRLGLREGMGQLLQARGHEKTASGDRLVDAKAHPHVLLEAVEEGPRSLQDAQEMRHQRRRGMDVCQCT